MFLHVQSLGNVYQVFDDSCTFQLNQAINIDEKRDFNLLKYQITLFGQMVHELVKQD